MATCPPRAGGVGELGELARSARRALQGAAVSAGELGSWGSWQHRPGRGLSGFGSQVGSQLGLVHRVW